jgi:hypothetical protein
MSWLARVRIDLKTSYYRSWPVSSGRHTGGLEDRRNLRDRTRIVVFDFQNEPDLTPVAQHVRNTGAED